MFNNLFRHFLKMILFTSLILMLFYDGFGSEENCSVESPLDICNFDVNSFEIPGDDIELEEFCKNISGFYSCYNDHYEEFSSSRLCGHALLMRNAEPTLKDLCREGSTLQTSYLESASCFKELSNKWDAFAKKNDRISERVIDVYQKLAPKNKYIIKLKNCIKLFQKTHAFNDIVLEECGPDSMLLYQKMLRDMKYYTLFCTHSEYQTSANVFRKVLDAIMDKEVHPEDLFYEISHSLAE